jgi:hypothetical protein
LLFVLFDNGTPRTLARYLIDHHTVTEARARGWDTLENGALLEAAEAAGFDVLVTTDKNLNYQQNLSARELAIVVLGQGRWSLIKIQVTKVVAAVNRAIPGSYTLVEIPFEWLAVRRADWSRRRNPPSGLDSGGLRLRLQPVYRTTRGHKSEAPTPAARSAQPIASATSAAGRRCAG